MKTVILGLIVLAFAGCNSSQPIAINKNAVANTKQTNGVTAASHSTDNSPNSANSNSSNPNSPMAKAVDVTEMTTKIEKAEKEFTAKPKDEKAKMALATAYFERATALTQAAQYRAALGDYRKGLKLNPSDETAKGMHDQIINIFKSIGREPPKEGEEPAPMPVK